MRNWIRQLWRRFILVPKWKRSLEPKLKEDTNLFDAALRSHMAPAAKKLADRNLAVEQFLRDAREAWKERNKNNP